MSLAMLLCLAREASGHARWAAFVGSLWFSVSVSNTVTTVEGHCRMAITGDGVVYRLVSFSIR